MIRPIALVMPALSVATLFVAAHGLASAASQPATLDLRAANEPLSALIMRIAHQCHASLAIDSALQNALFQPVTISDEQATANAAWKDALTLLANDQHVSLALLGDQLVVMDANDEFRKRLVRRTYDIRVPTREIVQVPGPRLDLPVPGDRIWDSLEPLGYENHLEAGGLVDDLKHAVRPSTWERAGVDILLDEQEHFLTITTLPEIHDEVLAYLKLQEHRAARQVVCRIHRLPDGLAPQPPTISADAWRKLADGGGAPIATFVMLDAQQNHHFCGTQSTVTADGDIIQGIYDPIVSVVSQGLSVDVEPVVTCDGVIATIGFNGAAGLTWDPTVISNDAGKPKLTIRTPRTQLDLSRDSRLIPTDGAALVRFAERTYALTFEVVNLPEAKVESKPIK